MSKGYCFELNEDQISLLCRFLDTFLPDSGNRRVSGANTIENIHTIVSDVFASHVGYTIQERDLIELLITKGYGFRTFLESWTSIKIPNDGGFYEQVYDEILEIRQTRGLTPHRLNVSVSAPDINLLRSSQRRIPIESGNPVKTIQPRIEMKIAVREFFGDFDGLRVEDYLPKNMFDQGNNL